MSLSCRVCSFARLRGPRRASRHDAPGCAWRHGVDHASPRPHGKYRLMCRYHVPVWFHFRREVISKRRYMYRCPSVMRQGVLGVTLSIMLLHDPTVITDSSADFMFPSGSNFGVGSFPSVYYLHRRPSVGPPERQCFPLSFLCSSCSRATVSCLRLLLLLAGQGLSLIHISEPTRPY